MEKFALSVIDIQLNTHTFINQWNNNIKKILVFILHLKNTSDLPPCSENTIKCNFSFKHNLNILQPSMQTNTPVSVVWSDSLPMLLWYMQEQRDRCERASEVKSIVNSMTDVRGCGCILPIRLTSFFYCSTIFVMVGNLSQQFNVICLSLLVFFVCVFVSVCIIQETIFS